MSRTTSWPIWRGGEGASWQGVAEPLALPGRALPTPPRPDAERLARHLYVHVPFCARRCSYCDFSIAVRRETPVGQYLRALGLELRQYEGAGAVLDTVYLGGGTPSRLGGAGVAGVLDAVRGVAGIAAGAEVTIEVNPEDVSAELAARWVEAGVNRVSLGVQSFDEGVLRWMHRTHTAEQSVRAVAELRRGGVGNISVDLIFAVPGSLGRDWGRDVQRVVQLGVQHVSLYGLTVEPGTPLGRWSARGEVNGASDEVYEGEFLMAHEELGRAGFEHYEVSNYGRPGLWSRHNSSYWSGERYIGVGPSAHGFDGARRMWNVAPYADWVRRLEGGESVVDGAEELTDGSRSVERVYLGLRTSQGLEANDAELVVARRWVTEGWAEIIGRTIVLGPMGWLRLDALAASLTLAGNH